MSDVLAISKGSLPARRWARVGLFLIIAGFIAISAACLVASQITPAAIEHYALHFSASGDLHIPVGQIESARHKLLIIGGLMFAVSAACLLCAGPITTLLAPQLDRCAAGSADFSCSVLTSVRNAGRLRAAAVLTFTIGAFILRWHFLFQPIRVDEAVTYLSYASKPLVIALSNYAEPNNHLLNTALVHASTLLFGNHPWSIRLPALLAGLCMVPLTYVVGLRLYDGDVGVAAAALVAAASYLVDFSTNGRGYTLQACLFLGSILIAQSAKSKKGCGLMPLLAIVVALGFYTVPTMLYAFAAILLWMKLSAMADPAAGARRIVTIRLLSLIVMVGVLLGIFYAPVLIVRGVGSLVGNTYVIAHTLPDYLRGISPLAAEVTGSFVRDLRTPIGISLLLAIVLTSVWHRSRWSAAKDRVPFVPVMLLACLVCTFAQRLLPPNRVWTLIYAPMYVAAAAGIVELCRAVLPQNMSAAGAIVTSFVAFGWAIRVWGSDSILNSVEASVPESEQVAQWIEAHSDPGDCVLMPDFFRVTVYYYLRRDGATPSFFYIEPRLLPRRAWMIEYEPMAPYAAGVAELQKGNPNLAPLELAATIGHARIYKAINLPTAAIEPSAN